MTEEQVRFGIKADSELPMIIAELNKLISTQEQLGALGEKMSKKQQDAYRTQSLAIRDLTDTIQANYSAAEKSSNAQSEFIKKQTKEFEGLGDTVKSLRNQMIAAFGISEIKELIVKIFELTATWQKYEAALSVGLGSQAKATAALQMLQKYADVTNFTLDELADTFTKFANRGVVLGTENLQRIGDVANALQKPFAQLGEAILDINNTERWTELGIKAKTAGDKVSLTFKGVTLEVDRTEQAVMLAISAFGTLNGVQGQTEKQARTLQGKLSTLKDSAAGLGRTVGTAMTPAFEAAIEVTSGLVKVVGGSESAFTRTVNYVKAVVAAWLTYELAVNAAAIKTTALSVAMVAKEAVMKGTQIAVGTYNLAMQALSGVIDVNYKVTTKAATAARGFWAALAANPIGAVVAIVGTLITSYQLYKAATTEVTTALGEEELKLRVQQKELKFVSDMALSAAAGTDERKRAINRIMKDYPDYFKGIDVEKLSNAELKAILDKVNTSYSRRIELARESYKVEQLNEKQKSLFQQEAELMDRLAEKWPELAKKAGGSVTELMKIVETMSQADKFKFSNVQGFGEWLDSAFNGRIAELAPKIAKGLEDVEKQYKEHTGKINKINEDALPVAVKLENERWAKVSANLEQGSEKYTKAYLDHQVRLLKAQGEYISTAAAKGKDGAKKSAAEIQQIELSAMEQTFEVREKLIEANATVETEKLNALYKKKKISEEEFNTKMLEISKKKAADLKKLDDEREAQEKLSAAEIQKINLEAMEKTYETRRKIIENSANIEIQQVNQLLAKEKITREQATEKIAQIEQKKTADLLALKNEENGKVEALTKQLQDSIADINLRAGKEVIKINQETVKKIIEGKMELGDYEKIIQKERLEEERKLAKELEKIDEDAAKIRNETAKREFNETQKILEQWIGRYSKIAGEAIGLWNGFQTANENLVESTYNVEKAQDAVYAALLKSGSQSKEYKEAQKDLAKAQQEQSKASMDVAQMNLNLASTIAQVAEAIKDYLVDEAVKAYQLIAEAISRTKKVLVDYYNAAIQANKVAMDTELDNFQGTWKEKEKIMKSYFAKEKEMMAARDRMDAELSFQQNVISINADTTKKISDAWDISKGPFGPQALLKVLTAFKEHNAQLQATAYEREAYEEQLRQQRIQQEVDAARQVRNERIDAIEEAFNKYKEKIEAEIELAEQARDTKVGILKDELDVLKDKYRQEVDAVKAAYDTEVSALKGKQSQEEAALRATYDLKQSLLAQSTNDEIEAIAVLDRTRNEALERYRTAEVARLTATRDRILATLTDENEKKAITEEYDRQIAAVHTEVEDAKLDKTKGIALATKQLRNEEKDESIRLKGEEKTAIEKLQDDFQIKFKDLADQPDKKLADMATDQKTREEALNAKIVEIQNAAANDIKKLKGDIANKDRQANDAMTFENEKYRNFVIQSNSAMLASQKAMAIAQLRAEIAILKGKKNIFNSARINSAIGDIEGAISELEGIGTDTGAFAGAVVDLAKKVAIDTNKANKTPFNSDTMQAVSEAYDRTGNVITLTYTDEDREFIAFDKNGTAFKLRNAYGIAEKTGEKFFRGSEWVDGIGYPDGIDTVPAWLTKGERIVPTSLNEKLGPKVSNEELVKSHLVLDELKAKFPEIRIPEFGMLNYDVVGQFSKPTVDLTGLEREVKKLTEAIEAKPELRIDVDANRITVAEIGRNQQHITYYENLYKR